MPYQLPRSESVLTACELLTLQQNNHAKVHSFLTHHAVSSSSTVCKSWQKSFVYTVPLYCVARIQLWGWQWVLNGNLFIKVGDLKNLYDCLVAWGKHCTILIRQGPQGLGLAWILQNRKRWWQRRHADNADATDLEVQKRYSENYWPVKLISVLGSSKFQFFSTWDTIWVLSW